MKAPLMQWHGRCSTFGGPHDQGVRPSEGLALYGPGSEVHAPPNLFLPLQPPNTTGLARRLNPNAMYCACRWNYKTTGGVVALRGMAVRVTVAPHQAGQAAKSVWVHPCDWGPNENTGRVIDLSPGAAAALNVTTDDTVTVELYESRDTVEESDLS